MTSPARIERHRRIADAVRSLVAEQGLRLSMEAVAARAGCSKQTLYTNYGNKHELVRRVIIDRLDATAARWDADKHDLRMALLTFAGDHLEYLASDNTVAARRLILAETRRYTEEASAVFELAVEGLQRQLSARLHTAIRQGKLRDADADAMAEMLMAMISGLDVERRHFGEGQRSTQQSRADWAAFAVDTFLRAFAS
jgi:AcrR family transcriptional regulator